MNDISLTTLACVRPRRVKAQKFAELWSRPGYLVRRLHQIHIGLFTEECQEADVTPLQCAILTILQDGDELDQRTISISVGVDRTSGADVIRRLERRGLVRRTTSRFDRRAKLVTITQAGKRFIQRAQPDINSAQGRMLAPLSEAERTEFLRLLLKMVEANNHSSRAPLAAR